MCTNVPLDKSCARLLVMYSALTKARNPMWCSDPKLHGGPRLLSTTKSSREPFYQAPLTVRLSWWKGLFFPTIAFFNPFWVRVNYHLDHPVVKKHLSIELGNIEFRDGCYPITEF